MTKVAKHDAEEKRKHYACESTWIGLAITRRAVRVHECLGNVGAVS